MSEKYIFVVNDFGEEELLILMTKNRALYLAEGLLNVHKKWEDGHHEAAYLSLKGGLARKIDEVPDDDQLPDKEDGPPYRTGHACCDGICGCACHEGG